MYYAATMMALKEARLPRYFFNVVEASGSVDDEEGTELPSLAAARAEAILDARALMSDAMLAGDDISSRHINVCDKDGHVLLRLEFADVMTRKY